MIKLVLILVLFGSFISYTQSSRDEFNAIFFPQGYGLKLLNSSGNSSIYNDISNLGFMNPASISGFNNYTFGLSYQLSSSIEDAYIFNIGISRVHDFYPQSVGGIVKWEGFTFGFGYSQKYNGVLDFGPIPVTTVNNPDGTGEFFEPIHESVIHNYSLTASYSFNELFQTSNDLSLGLRFNLNRFHQYEEIGKIKVTATDFFNSITLGLIYDITLIDERKLKIGLAYENKAQFKAEIKVDNNYLISPNDSIPNINIVPVKTYYVGSSPPELRFDFVTDLTQNIKILMNLTGVFWKDSENNLKDQLEYSAGAAYDINEKVSTGFGIYYSDRNYENDIYRMNSKFNVLFLTAGLKLNFKLFYADLTLADSHLFSGEFRKQTIGKFSIGITL